MNNDKLMNFDKNVYKKDIKDFFSNHDIQY